MGDVVVTVESAPCETLLSATVEDRCTSGHKCQNKRFLMPAYVKLTDACKPRLIYAVMHAGRTKTNQQICTLKFLFKKIEVCTVSYVGTGFYLQTFNCLCRLYV